jgi:signal transduction histidine kinase
MDNPSLANANIADDVKDDLVLFNILKPYIGHCLTINHDINNPLTGIIGYCEFLLEEAKGLDETHKGYLQQILQCAERVKKLAENLCEEKIALAEKINLKSVTEAYKKVAKPLD